MLRKAAWLPLLLVAPLSHAAGWYAGAEAGLLGAGEEEAETYYGGYGYREREQFDASSLGLKVGYQFRYNARAELTRTVIDMDYDHYRPETLEGLDLDAHYLINPDRLTPYIGAGLGFYGNSSIRDTSGDELNGLSINLMAGVQYEVMEHLMVDANWKYRGIAWQTIRVSNGYSSYDVDMTTSVSIIGAGVRYYF